MASKAVLFDLDGTLIDSSVTLSSFVGYLCEKYASQTEFVDVADQGMLSIVSALHLIKIYFSVHNINRTMLIGFDQRALPLQYDHEKKYQHCNMMGYLSFSAGDIDPSSQWIVLESDIIQQNNFSEKINYFRKMGDVFIHQINQLHDLFFIFKQLKEMENAQEKNSYHVIVIEDKTMDEYGVIVICHVFAI